MNDFILFDPLFRVPLLTGLCLAAALSLIGGFLKMREEWLSALGISQISAAGAVAGVALGVPVIFTAVAAAAGAALIKDLNPKSGNSHYAMMIILGWAASLLLAANTYHGEVAGETFLRGQLYFTHGGHLAGALILLVFLLAVLKWLSKRLLTERFFPDYYSANNIAAFPHRIIFAGLVVFSAVLGTVSIGAFPAFAMFFVPPWIGFVIVDGWKKSLAVSVLIAVAAYLVSFAAAVLGDQPFGPLLMIVLALFAMVRPLVKLVRRK